MPKTISQEWLLVFYSVPSHPVSNRMKIWRKLTKVGAVQLKGSVYILPATEEHEEFLQWLIGEVKSMGGDGAFVRSTEIKTMTDADIRRLFTTQAEREYHRLEKVLDVLERKIQSIRKGTKSEEGKHLADRVVKLTKEFEELRKRDYFESSTGNILKKRIQALEAALQDAGKKAPEEAASVVARRMQDYRGKIWATRKNPFVDRMASAWLIKRFVDPKASFVFIDERDVAALDNTTVAFDMRGAAFTHVGDLCTFEVFVKSFGIKDKAVKKIAEIVHDLDVKDDKYGKPETTGVEDILAGIRKTAKSDADGLERGMTAFEMLYQSKT
ncbi:MAG TPA: chromate resistance protein ChrB domain-containing protein [Nitrospirota bacterium]|nr:chromate resistance protein ChrB domain-containing protein [Nitrospirota bacterium]